MARINARQVSRGGSRRSRAGRPARRRIVAWLAAGAVVMTATAGCDVNSALQRLSDARHLAASLHVQFTKASDVANRAVMADTDERSSAFAREAEQATAAAQKDAEALASLLENLGYSNELALLQEFRTRFSEYQKMERTILELAVENTNLKAQRLSFGSAQEAADAFRDVLDALMPLDAAKDAWHVKALAATAVAHVREIQVIQAPHIADPDDAQMTQMEKQMSTSEAAARSALKDLAPIVRPLSRPQLSSAGAALDRFMEINAQIVGLSRRNTNVRSVALSLNQKAKLTAECETSLRALQDALGKRGFTGTR